MGSGKRARADRHRRAEQRDNGRAVSGEASPEFRDELLLQAVIAYRADRLGEAEGFCQRILELERHYPPAMQLIGMIAGRTGRTALGIEMLREVVTQDPSSVDARNEL